MGYSRNFGSTFPETQLVIQEKKDVDDSIWALVKQIETYIKAGNTVNANAVLEANKDTLEPALIDSSFINLLQEEIYNIGRYSLMKQQTIISDTMPTDMEVAGSYWMQDFE